MWKAHVSNYGWWHSWASGNIPELEMSTLSWKSTCILEIMKHAWWLKSTYRLVLVTCETYFKNNLQLSISRSTKYFSITKSLQYAPRQHWQTIHRKWSPQRLFQQLSSLPFTLLSRLWVPLCFYLLSWRQPWQCHSNQHAQRTLLFPSRASWVTTQVVQQIVEQTRVIYSSTLTMSLRMPSTPLPMR